MMSEQRVVRTLRTMAWQRAKGELASMLETFWDSHEDYERMRDAINAFTKEVEDNGWQE